MTIFGLKMMVKSDLEIFADISLSDSLFFALGRSNSEEFNFKMSLWKISLDKNSNENISKIFVLEVYYFKVTTKQSLSSCKQNIDSLFVLTLK